MSDNSVTIVNETKPWLFRAGNNANPNGRPKGSRNKLGEQFVQALQADFEEHGKQVIETVRVDRPHEYLKVIASLLPKQLEIREGAFDGVSDEQLGALIAAARAALNFVESREEGSDNKGEPQPPQGLQTVSQAV